MSRPKDFIDKPCKLCRSRKKVRWIQRRLGMGTYASYEEKPEAWCLKCCKLNNGAYQLA